MTPGLRSITIQDFRCISGTTTIPLKAPVVLIHGPNGTGKTTVLSAIELALTGELPAMRRLDSDYLSHVVRKGADQAKITLSAWGLESEAEQTTSLTIRGAQLHGTPLLGKPLGHFFSERCNLAQSTLGRLLEIYQHASPREDSQLTRFVKDLLGLDRLEALIDGLASTGDVRNTRKLAPRYREFEERINNLGRIQNEERQKLVNVRGEARALRVNLSRQLGTLAIPQGLSRPSVEQMDAVEQFLTTDSEDNKLIALSQKRRELAGMRAEWLSLATGQSAIERSAVEGSEREATSLAEVWRNTSGKELEAVLDELRETFPDLPSSASTDPELARNTALRLATTEIQRCSEGLAQADIVTSAIEKLEQTIERHKSRSTLLDQQISSIAGNAESLGRSLAALLPHIHSEDCPVCGRDFKEISTEPLVAHLSAKVARLTEEAGRLQALSTEKNTTMAALSQAERSHIVARNSQISQEVRVALKSRVAHLSDCTRKLTGLAARAIEGVEILRKEATQRKELSSLRIRDQRATELRGAIATFCVEMEQPPLGPTHSVEVVLGRLEHYLSTEEIRLQESQNSRRAALTEFRRLTEIEKTIASMEKAIEGRQTLLDVYQIEFEIAEKRRGDAKHIASAAREVRTGIVTRVFNDSLNKIWRDLFVRLAPSEPFIPAFKVPQTDRAVMAILETVHREGGHGGAPGAMLSAGNLNTAALTLFLALHLSVRARLPWLILDDPVQSMDEVHITQFAALLRTISKGHGRQIVMAVHDRPLFEYLALELSPAFNGDELITVELSQSQTGTTIAEPEFRLWKPDAVAA